MHVDGTNTYNYDNLQNKSATKNCSNAEISDLFEFSTVSDNNTESLSYTDDYKLEMSVMVSTAQKMVDNVDILSNLGANDLTSIALSASSKANSIIVSVKSAIGNYSARIAMIANNPLLSDSEKKAQIQLIEDKIKACAYEGTLKIQSLFCISEVITSFASTYMAIKAMGIDTKEMKSMFKQLLSNVNTKPSDFSTANDKNDLYQIVKENQKNFFGKNSNEMFSKFIENTDKKIEENENKLKNSNLSLDEKKRIKLELMLYHTEKNLFMLLAK